MRCDGKTFILIPALPYLIYIVIFIIYIIIISMIISTSIILF